MPHHFARPQILLGSSSSIRATQDSLGNTLSPMMGTNGLVLLACFGFIGLTYLLPSGTKKKLASGRFGGGKEMANAKKQAKKQMEANKYNELAAKIGKKIWLPDLQRGVSVCGGPGSGKTFSIINPAIRSVVRQGKPIIVYDFKYPTQAEEIVAFAKFHGYQVRIFAPGYPESDICNPLDFMRSPTDAETARQLAIVMNRNFKLGNEGPDDPFFTAAGDQLAEAIFMLAKGIKGYGDVATCQTLLSLPNLPSRVEAAADAGKIPYTVRASFGQIISVAPSEKTVSSIIGTANSLFTRFMKPSLLGSFCGKTTLPLDLEGKQMIVFGMDRNRRDVVGPLVATILHMIVTRNVARKRKDPLFLALDELPTIYLPAITQWLNENRSDGLAVIIGFQNLVQLEHSYGPKLSRAILGGTATKAIFNPQEDTSAQLYSTFLGDAQIEFKQKSHSFNAGKKSRSISDQDRTAKLFGPQDFLKLPKGKMILLSPGFESQEESFLPLKLKAKFPQADLLDVEKSKQLWSRVQDLMARFSPQVSLVDKDFAIRHKITNKLFPEPGNKAEPNSPSPKFQLDPEEYAAGF